MNDAKRESIIFVAQAKGIVVAPEAPAWMRLSALDMIAQIDDLTAEEKAAIAPATAEQMKLFREAYGQPDEVEAVDIERLLTL